MRLHIWIEFYSIHYFNSETQCQELARERENTRMCVLQLNVYENGVQNVANTQQEYDWWEGTIIQSEKQQQKTYNLSAIQEVLSKRKAKVV